MADKIQKAYQHSKSIYDNVLTQANFWSRLYIQLFWNGVDDNEIARKTLAYLPENFNGTLLDVPVGTGVFTSEKYQSLPEAKIFCIDYSRDMLEKARLRFRKAGLENVRLKQGDVGNLPLKSGSCDIVLSMNGFHAFPDQKKAFSEVYRVLKKDGMFIACFYIKEESVRTDWLVEHVLAKKGWFTPPFQTFSELKKMLENNYAEVEIYHEFSMVYFRCAK
ncbi:MAG: class I SAM-dependent methyltransferase [Oscillospiraceae bacterium]|nr:class I SAM-dependent methyltransferase [Oscillospiraceae bacterium]